MTSRPPWAEASDITRDYFDNEWGNRLTSEQAVFEALCLLTFQCGITWHAVLMNRDGLRNTFSDFDPDKVAALNPGPTTANSPIKNLRKTTAVIQNAKATIALRETGGLPKLIRDAAEEDPNRLPKTLRSLGFAMIGPKMVKAFLETVGLIDLLPASAAPESFPA